MSELSSVERIESLKNGIESKTSKTYPDLTAAVQDLVDEEPVIESLEVTENGTYTAPDGVDGYGTVTVNVEGSGNTDIEDALISGTITEYTNNRMTSIGAYAFYSFTSLTSINFPICTAIGSGAFARCSSLTSVNLPKCTTIGSDAFYGCTSLATVNFPVCTTIGSDAFGECTSLATVNFPICTSIGIYAFRYCKSLTTASFPNCTTIGDNAFQDCSSLTSVNFPVCTSINTNIFWDCSSLISVSFPICTTIGEYAFNNCRSLTSVSFPACTTISSYAFYYCPNLISLYLTGSRVCTLLNSTAFASTPIGGYSTVAGQYGSIFVPASLVDAYKITTNWAYFADRIAAIEGDSGDSGESTTLITFTIAGVEYQAETGMTWGEWVESEYNTKGYSEDSSFIILDDKYSVITEVGNKVLNSDIIANGYNYTHAK